MSTEKNAGKKITYRVLQTRDGRLYGESADTESLRLILAIAEQTHKTGGACLILRNTYGPKGRVSSGRIVWATEGIREDSDVVAAPHVSTFFTDLTVPSFVKLCGHGVNILAA